LTVYDTVVVVAVVQSVNERVDLTVLQWTLDLPSYSFACCRLLATVKYVSQNSVESKDENNFSM